MSSNPGEFIKLNEDILKKKCEVDFGRKST